jgi:hypothetical protein
MCRRAIARSGTCRANIRLFAACWNHRNMGLQSYALDSKSQRIDEGALCIEARARGFDSVMILESPDRSSDSEIAGCTPECVRLPQRRPLS